MTYGKSVLEMTVYRQIKTNKITLSFTGKKVIELLGSSESTSAIVGVFN